MFVQKCETCKMSYINNKREMYCKTSEIVKGEPMKCPKEYCCSWWTPKDDEKGTKNKR